MFNPLGYLRIEPLMYHLTKGPSVDVGLLDFQPQDPTNPPTLLPLPIAAPKRAVGVQELPSLLCYSDLYNSQRVNYFSTM